MSTVVQVKWTGDMAFEAEVNGHRLLLDADENVGGADKGPRPKALLLSSLGGCTGMDVISILKKMRVDIEGFEMRVEAEVSDEHPKIYHAILLVYIFTGKDLPLDKLQKAVELSQEKYCGVSAMLKHASKLSFRVETRESL